MGKTTATAAAAAAAASAGASAGAASATAATPATAAADTKPGQGRVKLRKVKTGCYTCKARRVKCDEEKPYCRRCTNAGRRCEGYYSTASLNSERRAAAPPTALSLLPDCSERERRYFHFYHARTLDSICAYFGSYLWSTLVPQVSLGQPAVRHALLALTALHESITLAGPIDIEAMRLDASSVFAVVHYNKAIEQLLAPAEAAASTDTVLLCCIIFVCIELMRTNTKAALVHIQAGLRLLADHRRRGSAEPLRLSISTQPANLDESLDSTFARLDIQSMFLGATPQLSLAPPHSSHPSATPPPTPSGIPPHFSSLPEARAYLETLANSSFLFMRRHPGPQLGAPLTPDQAELHAREMQKFEAWSTSFAPLLDCSRTCSNPTRRSAHVLKIHQVSMLIWLASHTRRSDVEFDRFTPQFTQVVELARSVVLEADHTPASRASAEGSKASRPDSWPRPDFAFDFGAISALHFTAMKCRVPHLRREAIQLLAASPPQEGVINRDFVGRLAAFSLEAEEKAAAEAEERKQSVSSASTSSRLSDASASLSAPKPPTETALCSAWRRAQQHSEQLRQTSQHYYNQLRTADDHDDVNKRHESALSRLLSEADQAEWSSEREQKMLLEWNAAVAASELPGEPRSSIRSSRELDLLAEAPARRASNGRVVEANGGRIMGYDVRDDSYSFDMRQF